MSVCPKCGSESFDNMDDDCNDDEDTITQKLKCNGVGCDVWLYKTYEYMDCNFTDSDGNDLD